MPQHQSIKDQSIKGQNIEVEAQRLQALIPIDLDQSIEVMEITEIRPKLIQSKSVAPNQYCIQIDFVRWFLLSIDQRNLLFWHEISCIQNRAIGQHRSDWIVLGIGLSAACTEVLQQNVGLLTLALTVSGLAIYQLYQRNWGERQLKNAVAADQSAIAFATQFGYSRSRAYQGLYGGIRNLQKFAQNQVLQGKLEARLQVLEVLAHKSR
jgi:hypothetical protein